MLNKIILILFLWVISGLAQIIPITLTWNPNTEPDLLEYRVYSGVQFPLTYDTTVTVNQVTLHVWPQFEFIEFAITAVDAAGNESDFSESVRKYRIDLNSDGIIDGFDLLILNRHWGKNYTVTDLNNDYITDGKDLMILNRNWGMLYE